MGRRNAGRWGGHDAPPCVKIAAAPAALRAGYLGDFACRTPVYVLLLGARPAGDSTATRSADWLRMAFPNPWDLKIGRIATGIQPPQHREFTPSLDKPQFLVPCLSRVCRLP